MHVDVYISLLVAFVGSLFYLLSTHPKRSELGRVAFGVGLLAFLLRVASAAHFGIG